MILHMAIGVLFSVPERKKRIAVIHGDVGYFPEASPSNIFSLYSRRQCSGGEVRVWYEGNNRKRRRTMHCYCSLWKSHRNKRCVQEELPKGERVLYMGKAETWHFPASTDKRYREILSRIEKYLLQSTCSNTRPDNLDSRQCRLVLRLDIFCRLSVHPIGPILKGQLLEMINLRCVRFQKRAHLILYLLASRKQQDVSVPWSVCVTRHKGGDEYIRLGQLRTADFGATWFKWGRNFSFWEVVSQLEYRTTGIARKSSSTNCSIYMYTSTQPFRITLKNKFKLFVLLLKENRWIFIIWPRWIQIWKRKYVWKNKITLYVKHN